MSNLKKKVIHSFKWKKNDEYCASKIGVSEEEYKKLKICGTNSSRSVLLKWPRIAATANVMPAKCVNVSPTNIRAGHQFKQSRPREVATKGTMIINDIRCCSSLPVNTTGSFSCVNSKQFITTIASPITTDCPASKPLIPA